MPRERATVVVALDVVAVDAGRRRLARPDHRGQGVGGRSSSRGCRTASTSGWWPSAAGRRRRRRRPATTPPSPPPSQGLELDESTAIGDAVFASLAAVRGRAGRAGAGRRRRPASSCSATAPTPSGGPVGSRRGGPRGRASRSRRSPTARPTGGSTSAASSIPVPVDADALERLAADDRRHGLHRRERRGADARSTTTSAARSARPPRCGRSPRASPASAWPSRSPPSPRRWCGAPACRSRAAASWARVGRMVGHVTSAETPAPPAAMQPGDWEADVVLNDGGTAHLRPIRPDDADRLRRFHSRLSQQTVYNRFFAYRPTLSDADVRALHPGRPRRPRGAGRDAARRRSSASSATTGCPAPTRARSPSSSRTPTRAAASGRCCSSTSPPPPASAGSCASSPTCCRPTGRCSASSAAPATRCGAPWATATSSCRSRSSRPSTSLEVMRDREHRAEARSVQRLLRPTSVAVVGASREPGAPGHEVLRSLLAPRLRGPGVPGQPGRRARLRRAGVRRRPRHPRPGRPGRRRRAGARGRRRGAGLLRQGRARAGRRLGRLRRRRARRDARGSRRSSGSPGTAACA